MADAFQSAIQHSLEKGNLASCQFSVLGERIQMPGEHFRIRHIKIVAPSATLLQAVGQSVERAARQQGLDFKRWASPRDGHGLILYEVRRGSQRLCSVLLMTKSAEVTRTPASFPPEEMDLRKLRLPNHFNGNYRIAIIIDDLGDNLEAAKELAQLKENVTFSILPEQRFTRETAELAKSSGKQVIVHLPLEPEPREGLAVDPKTIMTSMSPSKVESLFEEDVDSVPFAVGLNNHMGSKATANRALMIEILALTKWKGFFFIDSRTTAETQAYEIARELGVPTNFRSVFLDDEENIGYTEGQLNVLLKRMLEQGSAIAIGHPFPSTIEALRRRLPEFERRGVKIVFVSHLVS